MYAKKLSIYNFKCFGKAVLDLQYPGRKQNPRPTPPLEMPNVNLIVGDNGGGKSSVLRAVAIAALAPTLLESGFVPYRLVQRPDAKDSLLKLVCQLDPFDLIDRRKTPEIELLARIDRRDRGSLDRLHLERTPSSPMEQLIYDDYSHAFFVVGYGATRRVEAGDYSQSSARKQRGLRYERVAGLFEDIVPLRPIGVWFAKLDAARRREAITKLARVLPPQLKFKGRYDSNEDQFLFEFEGRVTPFAALSDGYKAFLGWVGDLIGHLCDVAPPHLSIEAIPGIVLIDEIDLHLHPAWQRSIVSMLSAAFPRLQFIMTSHSPLVANTLRKENIFVTDVDGEGWATVKQIGENVHGRGADQLLLSSYFGLTSTLPPALDSKGKTLFARAADGDSTAALAFLEQISAPLHGVEEVVPAVEALSRNTAGSDAAAGSSRKRAGKLPAPKAKKATKKTSGIGKAKAKKAKVKSAKAKKSGKTKKPKR
ncbi:AAA family ATPase [Bradyrhizobium sp. USDA 4504]